MRVATLEMHYFQLLEHERRRVSIQKLASSLTHARNNKRRNNESNKRKNTIDLHRCERHDVARHATCYSIEDFGYSLQSNVQRERKFPFVSSSVAYRQNLTFLKADLDRVNLETNAFSRCFESSRAPITVRVKVKEAEPVG